MAGPRLPNAGLQNATKPVVNEAEEKKRADERRMFEQHHADYYIWNINNSGRHYALLGDRERNDIPANERPDINTDPSVKLQLSARAGDPLPLFYKPGTYNVLDNNNALKGRLDLKLDENKQPRIYVHKGSGGTIHDAIDFAMKGQGSLLKGIEYDVGNLSAAQSGDPTESLAFRYYDQRMRELDDVLTRAEKAKEPMPISLSENTKDFLKLLIQEGVSYRKPGDVFPSKFTEADMYAILQREELLNINARNTQNKALVNASEKEFAKITELSNTDADRFDVEKIKTKNDTSSNVNDKNKDPMETVSKNVQAELDKIKLEYDLLKKIADHANNQADGLAKNIETRDKIIRASEDSTNPHQDADFKHAQELITAVENSQWVIEKKFVDLLGEPKKEGDYAKGNGRDKVDVLQTKLQQMRDALNGEIAKLENFNKKLQDLKGEKNKAQAIVSKREAEANNVHNKIEDFNNSQPDDKKIKFDQLTTVDKLNADLKLADDKKISPQAFEDYQKLQLEKEVKALKEVIDDHNKKQTVDANKVDIAADSLSQIQTKLGGQAGGFLNAKNFAALQNPSSIEITFKKDFAASEAKLTDYENSNKANLSRYDKLKAEVDKIDAFENGKKENPQDKGYKSKFEELNNNYDLAAQKRANLAGHIAEDKVKDNYIKATKQPLP